VKLKPAGILLVLIVLLDPAPGAAAEPAWPEGWLPAWETEWEKKTALKADEWDDFREEHPEWFSVTAPPVVAVRPFAEYEPTQAVLMRPSGSISKFHKGIIGGALGHVDRVVLFHVTGQKDKMKAQLKSADLWSGSIEFVDVEKVNANWTRDYGPLSVVAPGGQVGFVDFRYYHGRAYDDAIPSKLADQWGINVFRPSMSYEGGNFMADPQGTCYATQKIYNQNAGHSKAEVTTWMEQYMGCTQMVILKLPKKLGTGHIDMFCKLMDDTTILLGEYDPGVKPTNAAILDENEQILKAVINEAGQALELFRIPLPWNDTGVWYTYTNSLIVNDTVLVPVFNGFDDLEKEALEVYEQAAPGLSVWTVDSNKIIPAGGAIHCVTMTVPAGLQEEFQDPPVQLCELNELNKCDNPELPCGGIPYEGTCEENLLKYCGADGYPHAQSCDACCGWDPAGNLGNGWYDCLTPKECAVCVDECGQGTSGCSGFGTHSWKCGEFDDDECLERKYEACGADAACSQESGKCEADDPGPCEEGVCPEECGDISEEGLCAGDLLLWCDEEVLLSTDCKKEGKVCGPVPSLGGSLGCWEGCSNECSVEGARECSEDGASVIVCRADNWGCLERSFPQACPDGTACFDGVCTLPRPETGFDDLVAQPDSVVEALEDPGSESCGCSFEGPPKSRAGCLAFLIGAILFCCFFRKSSEPIKK